MEFENTIGLETHVQLKTRTKMFCGCLLKTGCEPNTNVCPVCLGYPGALPVMNREAVKFTVMSGMMLGCEVNRHATFDRKNYFYPDMAKDYQISENGNPLCIGGGVEIVRPDGTKKFLEPVWHRATLDLLAALALTGPDRFVGTVVSYRAGHTQDCDAVRALYRNDLLKRI